ncbi:hypothetical protein JCM25156A_31030 [Komagataeibacter kakiaceti JCM 25156]
MSAIISADAASGGIQARNAMARDAVRRQAAVISRFHWGIAAVGLPRIPPMTGNQRNRVR